MSAFAFDFNKLADMLTQAGWVITVEEIKKVRDCTTPKNQNIIADLARKEDFNGLVSFFIKNRRDLQALVNRGKNLGEFLGIL